MSKKLINKKNKKLYKKKCFFCDVDDYNLLDVHRIQEGQKYDDFNTLVVCANCHRKIHSSQIKIDRKYKNTSGSWSLRYWSDNQEFWKND